MTKKQGKHAAGAKKAPANDKASREAAAEAALDALAELEEDDADDATVAFEPVSMAGARSGPDEFGALAAELPAVVPPLAAGAEGGQGAFAAAGFSEVPLRKKRRGLKAFGITVGVLAAVVALAYVVGAVVFMGRFLPNTRIGDYDISLKTDAEAVSLLDGIVPGYSFAVIGNGDGFSYRTTGDQLGVAVDSQGIVDAIHADLNAWRWPLLISERSHDETSQFDVTFDEASFRAAVTEAVAKFNEGAKDPVNATIAYNADTDSFVVKPEQAGTKYDVEAVIAAMCAAIDELDEKLVLGPEQLVKPTVLSTDEKLIAAAQLATGMVSAQVSLTMGGLPVGEITGDALSEFITVGGDYSVVFKEEEMASWVDNLVAGFNTVGSERTYTRADGKAIAVSGGVYGWEVDSAALKSAVLEAVKAGGASKIEVPCIDAAAVYNGPNQRDWGNRYIDVDISEQHVRFYGADGNLIWETDCISGSPDGKHDTVEGVWVVNAKESPSKLIGYENGKKIYETSVKFWMPFEGNSIGFHDATWQPSFGGSMYANGYGSHGCVNLSYADAEALYGIIEEGDVVVVHK